MSYYSYYSGELRFQDKKNAEKAYEIMGEWLHESLKNEEGKKSFLSRDVLKLRLMEDITENDGMRNLNRKVEAVIRECKCTGKVVGTSTDGCFEGWIQYGTGEEECFDLDKWAVNHVEEDLQDMGRFIQKFDKEDNHTDGEWEEYSAYRNEVEMAFHEDHE